MKRSIFLALALTALCGTVVAAPSKKAVKKMFPPVADLGNVMYVGDSITHGVAAASYRWPLFKIWVDNGIAQNEVGVHARNHSGGVEPNSTYGEATFLNVHSAISSERAYEIAGRINNSGRLENSCIFDWLGLNKGYSGNRTIDPSSEMPQNFFMMIGTNDTLSDSGKAGIHSCIGAKEKDLLGKKGDMGTIIGAMRQGNAKARITVTTIPTWAPGRANNGDKEDFAAIQQYNEKLKAWGRSNKVAVVEVNKGMVDMPGTKDIPFVGHPAMFGRDKLHPSDQGDLIIAGNVAQQLGYAGRTAGLTRKAAGEFPMQAEALAEGAEGVTVKKRVLSLAKGGSISASGQSGQGATVEFQFGKNGYGDGPRGGWDDSAPLAVTLSSGNSSGTLHISEGYIAWEGGSVLYSADMSGLHEPIRMAWVAGAPAKGLQPGFYVWLGDMLIGEGLPGTPGGKTGLQITAGGEAVTFRALSYDPENSWAPASPRFSAGNPLIESSAAPAAPAAAVADDSAVIVKTAADAARLSAAGNGAISAAKATGTPRKIVFDGAPVSAKALKLADAEEVHILNGSAVVLDGLGGARKLVVDSTSRLGLAAAAAEYEASVLNSGTIILPKGATLSLRPEGTDENEGGTYIINGGTLKANNVRMSNTIRQNGGEVTGLSPETFMGKHEKK